MRPTHIMVGSHQQRTTAYHLSGTILKELLKKKKPVITHGKFKEAEIVESWTYMDQTFQTLRGREMKGHASTWTAAKAWNPTKSIPSDWPK